MKKLLLVLICALVIFQNVSFAINEASSFNLWKRKQTYNDLVHRVGKQVIKGNNIKTHYVFYAQGRGIPNASVYPREVVIFVNTMMMRSMSSDDELASVISHEIAHKELGHGTVIREFWKGCLFPARPYIDRKEEKVSDIKAVDYMVKAGYDPFAWLVLQDRVLNEPDRWQITKWFRHYPTAKERITLTGNYIMANYPENKNGYFATKFREDSVFADLIDWGDYANLEDTSNSKLMKELHQDDL